MATTTQHRASTTGKPAAKKARPGVGQARSHGAGKRNAKRPFGDVILCSKVSKQSQTTLPSGVRKALGVQKGDELVYVIEGNRAIVSKRTEHDSPDPALLAFLDHLQSDIATRPQALSTLPMALFARMSALAADVVVDYEEQIEGPVAL